jgi:hypothetical protein
MTKSRVAGLLIIPRLLLVPLAAFGSGYYPCCIELKLDKMEYLPGEKVLISVIATGNFAESTEPVSIKITEVTYGLTI